MRTFVRSFDAALVDADEAIRLSPKDAYSHWLRGEVYATIRRLAEAVGDFDTAIRLDPTQAGYYTSRAEAYERLGQLDAAKRDRMRAEELGAGFPGSFHAAGGHHHRAAARVSQADAGHPLRCRLIRKRSPDGVREPLSWTTRGRRPIDCWVFGPAKRTQASTVTQTRHHLASLGRNRPDIPVRPVVGIRYPGHL